LNRAGFVIPLVLLVTVLNAAGQVLTKKAVAAVGADGSPLAAALRAFTTGWLYLGLGVIALGTVTWLIILSRAELSYATPFTGVTILVVAWFASMFLGEPVTPMRVAGTVVIALGVAMVARS
jgi:drug/metabolite transporter (DMT)-like permease